MDSEIYFGHAVASLNHLFRHLYPLPLEWDRDQSSFLTLGEKHKKYRRYRYLSLFIYAVFAPLGSLFSIWHFHKSRPINAIISCLFIPIAYCEYGFAHVLLNHTGDIVKAFQNLKLELRRNTNLSNFQFHFTPNAPNRRERNWKLISLRWTKYFAQISICTSAVLPVVLIVKNLDMFYSVQEILFSCHGSRNITMALIFLIFRYIFIFMCYFDGFRNWAVVYTMFFLWLEMQSKYLNQLRRSLTTKAFVSSYQKLQLCFQTWENGLNQLVYFIMSGFFAIIVMSNLIFVNFRQHLPVIIWWYMPMLSVLLTTLLTLWFPFIVECHEQTKLLLRRQKSLSKSNWRKLHGLRPVSVKCAGAFIIKRETRSTFLESIVMRTVDGILMYR